MQGINYVGIEMNEKAHNYAKAWAAEVNSIANGSSFTYVRGTHKLLCEQNLSGFPSILYDTILVSEVIEHVPSSEISSLVQRLDCALRPGGKIIITVPNRFHLRNTVRHIFGLGVLKMDVDHVIRFGRNPASFEYTYDEFKKEVIDATVLHDYDMIYFKSELLYFPMEKTIAKFIAPYSILRHWIIEIFPALGCHFVYVFKKK